MAMALIARVVPEDGDAFDAPVANLTPSSLFVLTESKLAFRQALTLKLGEISLHGEVVFVCVEPPGAVITYRATVEALQELEDFMETLPTVVGGTSGTSLEDFRATSDEELDALPGGDPEGPTNTEGEPVEVEDEEPESEDEVRQAFKRSKFPPNLATERVSEEQLLAAKSAALARRPGDRDPTVVAGSVTVDAETDHGLEDRTESGAEVGAPVEPEDQTVVPVTPAVAEDDAGAPTILPAE